MLPIDAIWCEIFTNAQTQNVQSIENYELTAGSRSTTLRMKTAFWLTSLRYLGGMRSGNRSMASATRRSTRFQTSFASFTRCCMVDDGIPKAPESDLHGAISSILIEAASGSDVRQTCQTSRFAIENDNAVLLWHPDATVAPHPIYRETGSSRSSGQPTGLVHFKLKDGPLTLCRFNRPATTIGWRRRGTPYWPYTQSSTLGWRSITTRGAQLIEDHIHHCSVVMATLTY